MDNSTGHVIKSGDVKMEGQFHLDIGQNAKRPASQQSTTPSSTQAHIVEKHPEFAIIEITCRCGEKIQLKCDYA